MKVKFDEKESFLKEVLLEEIPHFLKIRRKGVVQETLEFRFFTPKSVDGHWEFEKEILPSILHRRDEAKGEERLRHNHSLRMIKFHRFFPPRRSTRQFFIDWRRPQLGKEPTTWYEIISGMAEYAGIKDAGDYIRLVMKKEKVPLPSTELLRETIYTEPAPKISRTLESYCRFRDFFMKYWERFDYLATELLVPKMRQGEKHPLLTEMRERDYSRYEKAKESAQASEEFIMRRFLKDELQSERKVAQRYKPILEKATGLYQKYVDKAEKGKKSLAKSCFSSEFDSLINEHIAQVEEDEDRGLVVREGKIEAKQTYVDSLKESTASKDAGVKWSTLIEVIATVTSESNGIKLMQREAESFCLELLHNEITNIYRKIRKKKIRKKLTVPERRAFILAHFRRYKTMGKRAPALPFGGLIPIYEPVIWDFFSKTGERNQALVYSVLIFKYPPSAELRKRYAEELKEEWSGYISFRRSWGELTRADDRERKYREKQQPELPKSGPIPLVLRKWEKKIVSLEDPVGEDKEGHTLTLRDTLQENDLPDPAEDFEGQKKAFYQRAEKVCTPKQIEVLKLMLDEGYIEKKIGNMKGITQQAVSRIVLRAKERLRKAGCKIK